MSLTKEDLIDFNIIQGLKDLGGDDGDEFFKEIIDLYKQMPLIFPKSSTKNTPLNKLKKQ